MTPRLSLDPSRPQPDLLARAGEVLAAGGVAALPTETLYGLAADSASPKGLERLAAIKGREADKPFPLIIGEIEHLASLAAEVSPLARDLAQRFWPGPLTLVLPARPGLSPRLVSARGRVAVRLSSHPVAAGLARTLGRAVTATSANPAGGPPPADVADPGPGPGPTPGPDPGRRPLPRRGAQHHPGPLRRPAGAAASRGAGRQASLWPEQAVIPDSVNARSQGSEASSLY